MLRLAGGVAFTAACVGAVNTHSGVEHHELPHVKEFHGKMYDTGMIPLPPSFFYDVAHGWRDEPVWDPTVHLALEMPSGVAPLDTFELEPVPPGGMPRVVNQGQSSLAFTAPFKMFSDEGTRVLKSIVQREAKHAHRNHRNVELRGLYYRSKFIRSAVTDPTLLSFLANLAGEPLYPHFLLTDSPSVNFGQVTNDTVIKGVVDPWHFDSVAYVGVALISDIDGMVGGELQVVKRKRKEALSLIYETNNNLAEKDFLNVKYARAGNCIFVQGSEMVHRVTRVVSAKEPRLSLVMAFQPANAFQPDKTVLDTWRRFDIVENSADYEYFRTKAHMMSGALRSLVETEEPTRDGAKLARRLRAITAELERAASILENSTSDFIGFVNETEIVGKTKKSEL